MAVSILFLGMAGVKLITSEEMASFAPTYRRISCSSPQSFSMQSHAIWNEVGCFYGQPQSEWLDHKQESRNVTTGSWQQGSFAASIRVPPMVLCPLSYATGSQHPPTQPVLKKWQYWGRRQQRGERRWWWEGAHTDEEKGRKFEHHFSHQFSLFTPAVFDFYSCYYYLYYFAVI